MSVTRDIINAIAIERNINLAQSRLSNALTNRTTIDITRIMLTIVLQLSSESMTDTTSLYTPNNQVVLNFLKLLVTLGADFKKQFRDDSTNRIHSVETVVKNIKGLCDVLTPMQRYVDSQSHQNYVAKTEEKVEGILNIESQLSSSCIFSKSVDDIRYESAFDHIIWHIDQLLFGAAEGVFNEAMLNKETINFNLVLSSMLHVLAGCGITDAQEIKTHSEVAYTLLEKVIMKGAYYNESIFKNFISPFKRTASGYHKSVFSIYSDVVRHIPTLAGKQAINAMSNIYNGINQPIPYTSDAVQRGTVLQYQSKNNTKRDVCHDLQDNKDKKNDTKYYVPPEIDSPKAGATFISLSALKSSQKSELPLYHNMTGKKRPLNDSAQKNRLTKEQKQCLSSDEDSETERPTKRFRGSQLSGVKVTT